MRHSPRWRHPVTIAALIFVLALLTRIPFQSAYFVNWDAVQFGLGTYDFNLEHHRPHPPGYIGYIGAGWLANQVTGDPNTSFVVLSMVAGALAPALLLVLASDMMPRGRALVAAVVFAASPLLWYYSGVALTYSVECALAVAFALFAWRGRHYGGSWLIAASLTLAVLGAVRQTGMVLLLPLWAWAVWPASWHDRALAAGTLAVASLAWLVPLLWLAGGIRSYISASLALAELSGSSTSVFSGNIPGLARNWVFVGVSMAAALGAAALLFPGRPRNLRDRWQAIPRDERQFLALWLLPPLGVFLFLHMGQAGYVLMVLPPVFLAMARMMPKLASAWRGRAAAAGAVVGANALLVAWAPGLLYQALPDDSTAAVHVRQYSVADNDAHWDTLVTFLGGFDPDTTVVLTEPGGPRAGGSFRHLSYYLPEFQVYAASRDRGDQFGHLYSSHEREDTYDISRLSDAADVLPLPPGVYRAVIPDRAIAERIAPEQELKRYDLGNGVTVWTTTFRKGSTLVYENSDDGADDDARIRAVPRQLSALPGFVAWRSFPGTPGG